MRVFNNFDKNEKYIKYHWEMPPVYFRVKSVNF